MSDLAVNSFENFLSLLLAHLMFLFISTCHCILVFCVITIFKVKNVSISFPGDTVVVACP